MFLVKEITKVLFLMDLNSRLLTLGENGITEKNILVHDALEPNPGIQYMLANMRYPEYPVALGVIRSVEGTTYEKLVEEQISDIR